MSRGDKKTVIKSTDMTEEMQVEAVDTAKHALEKWNVEKDIAAYIKKEFDSRHGPTWHCILASSSSSDLRIKKVMYI
ncbi:putative Dynein 8 kDa light chain, flagellar outer arm [Nannochloris sp. 'desiccata']|nr:hypothetical protein KSW81_004089 [Chlorella desiccata (nom. nud.)]KAH7624601.1 putative Dynein 8 kDa light chain, flagellar outer arm [Chlorella desiccata (nom. nud.)]